MSEESTATEQPASDSIDQDIADAFAEMDVEVTNEADTTEAIVEDTSADIVPEETDVPDEIAAEAEDTEATEVTEDVGLTAPDHWSSENKTLFESQTPEAQQFLLDRHKEMEADYTRKTQDIAEVRNELGPYWDKFSAQRGHLQRQGISTSQYLENLTNADLMLSRDPVGGIRQIAQAYGVDLSDPSFLQEQSAVDPQVQTLQQELSELRNTITQRDQAAYETSLSTFQEQINSFATKTTETGEAAHPYFEEVMNDMVVLAQAEQTQGRTPELSKLYEQAVWANPTTRAKQLAADKAVQAADAEKRARAKAAKAKEASSSLSGSPDVSGVNASLSLEEELSANWG